MSRPSEYSFFDTDWGRYSSQQVPRVPTPEGFSAIGSTARMNPYQGPDETKPIGVPGTTLNQGHPDDKIMSIGGNFIVMGAAPGAETLRIQGKAGSATEYSADGSLKMVSAKGLHISSSGDGQWLVSGDLCFTSTGAFRLKCGGFYVDCDDYVVHATGSMVQNVTGDYNLNVSGDAHTTTQGDKTDVTAGTFRSLVAGQTLIQSHERIKIATNKSYELSAKDKGFIECKSDMTILTEGDLKQGAHGNMEVKVKGNSTFEVSGTHSDTITGDASYSSKGKINVVSAGDATVSSQANMNVMGATIKESSTTHQIAATDVQVHGTANVRLKAGVVHIAGDTSNLYTVPLVAGATGVAVTKADAANANDPQTDIAKTKTECPTDEEVHENTKQFSAKRTDYALKNVNGGLGAIHAMYHDSGENGQIDDKIKKEVDRHYGAGEYDKYAQKMEEPIAYAGATDTEAVPQYISDEHTGLA